MKNVGRRVGRRFLGFLVIAAAGAAAFPVTSLGAEAMIKTPNVSGQFYDADPKQLSARIDEYLRRVPPLPGTSRVGILMVPHAGYVYSGPVAAYGYKRVASGTYKTVVILAPSHYYPFQGAVVWPRGGFATPLGTLPVDEEFAERLLAADPRFIEAPEVFEREHSLEVQLPFIQKVLKDVRIVPVIMGQADPAACEALAAALDAVIGDRKDVLVVLSTDLSHYHDDAEARRLDAAVLDVVRRLDPEGLWLQCARRRLEMCGFIPVTTGLFLAKRRGLVPEVLHYANSGDVTGDRDRVVGYAAVVFHEPDPSARRSGASRAEAAEVGREIPPLTAAQKNRLLEIARRTVETKVRTGRVPDIQEDDPRLRVPEGAFVTLRRHGRLRGCIGRIVAWTPLAETVRDMAVAAATEDPRFPPVTVDELDDIEIEVSVLSQPRPVRDPAEIRMGVHGVIVKRGGRQGVFLPQVADETGWDRETFLSNLCAHKAGLPPDAWKDPRTRIEVFTADVFSEGKNE